jgi:5-methylcytosine-specific restriction endonuclease McrA
MSLNHAREWRKASGICRERFGGACMLCGYFGDGRAYCAHHWQETRAENPARKYDQDNLVWLCDRCHNHSGNDARFYELKRQIESKFNYLQQRDKCDL